MEENEFDYEQEEKDLKARNLERRLAHLREVLKDAENRGDYYLEFDVIEQILEIKDQLRDL